MRTLESVIANRVARSVLIEKPENRIERTQF